MCTNKQVSSTRNGRKGQTEEKVGIREVPENNNKTECYVVELSEWEQQKETRNDNDSSFFLLRAGPFFYFLPFLLFLLTNEKLEMEKCSREKKLKKYEWTCYCVIRGLYEQHQR